MAPGRRRNGSCWTCRLRRKRCNSARPVCGSCQDLEINCYQGESRPPWMDGAAKQKRMSEELKKAIKHSALLRREKYQLAHVNQSVITVAAVNLAPPTSVSSTSPVNITHGPRANQAALLIASIVPTSLSPVINESVESQSVSGVTSLSSDQATHYVGASSNSSWPAGSAIPINMQFASIMIYLDFVFPFLFPFYQPPLIETGRQWLLGLLCQNEASFHVAASLSAHFFTLTPQKDGQDMHDDCKALVWSRLVEQMGLAVKSIRDTVTTIDNYGARSTLLERTRLMEEITQLLIVEITVREDSDWTMHLTPALMLFDEIFKSNGTDRMGPDLAVVMNALPSSIPTTVPHHKPLPNTPDQSALVFFVSLLLFIDTIASTSLGASPVLHDYQRSLLTLREKGRYHMRLETVMGCQNWVISAIGNISALCAWKRNAKQSGNFSVVTLVSLGTPIAKALDEGLVDLDVSVTHSQAMDTSTNMVECYYGRHDRSIDDHAIAKITRIWACATKIYLSVSLSGWQPNAADTQANVADILKLVQTIDSPAQLQSLSWPFTVAGCLASPSQEHSFRRIVEATGRLGVFGTISKGLRIMETIWSSRDTIDCNSWDIASSLSVLGSPALLI